MTAATHVYLGVGIESLADSRHTRLQLQTRDAVTVTLLTALVLVQVMA